MNSETLSFPEDAPQKPAIPRWLIGTILMLASPLIVWGIYQLEDRRSAHIARQSMQLEENIEDQIYLARFISPEVTAAHIRVIEDIPTLRHIDLSNTKKVAGGPSFLSRHPGVQTLTLSRADWVTDETLELLATLPALREIDLQGTKVTHVGLQRLLDGTGVRRLGLSECRGLTSDAVDVLISADQLESVMLAKTGLPPEELKRLRVARPELELTIEEADLFPGYGQALETDADVDGYLLLRTFPHDWNTGKFADPPVLPLVRTGEVGLSTDTGASFSGRAAGERLAELLAVHPNASGLSLSDMRMTSENLSVIPYTLTGLSLTRIDPTSDIRELRRLTALKALTLRDSPVDPEQLAFLSELPRLQYVDMEGNMTDQHVQQLAGASSLEFLTLSGIQLGDESFAHLPVSIIKLHVFTRNDGDYRITGLNRLQALEELYMQLPPDDPQELAELQALPRLRSISLYSTLTDRHLEQLRGLPAVEFFNVGGFGITDAGAEELFEFPQIKSLRLFQTRVTPEMFERLRDHYHRDKIID